MEYLRIWILGLLFMSSLFIVEGANDTCTKQQKDVVFALDVSYSMRYGLEIGTEAILNIINQSPEFEAARIGLFTYNDVEEKLSWVFSLTDAISQQERDEKISELRWESKYGESHILAIETGWKHIQENKRTEIPRSLIIVTDGETLPEQDTLAVAERLICQGLNIFVLGINTDEYQSQGITDIAGGKTSRTFSATQTKELVAEICQNRHPVDFNEDKWAKNCDTPGGKYDHNEQPWLQMTDGGVGGIKCREKCAANPGCTFYSWGKYSGGRCWMKRDLHCPADAFIKKNITKMVCGYM